MFRFILALRHFLTLRSPLHTVSWSPEDADTLRRFLRSIPGSRLRALLERTIAEGDAAAVLAHDPYRCGYATGYRGAVADLLALAGRDEEP